MIRARGTFLKENTKRGHERMPSLIYCTKDRIWRMKNGTSEQNRSAGVGTMASLPAVGDRDTVDGADGFSATAAPGICVEVYCG